MTAIRALLAGSIDYAGLFPPAGLDMPEAAHNYARYLEGDTRWALGRFVVPAARLRELEGAAGGGPSPWSADEPWRLSVLLGSDAAVDVRTIDDFNCRHAAGGPPAAVADVVEAKAASPEGVTALLAAVPRHLQCYIEIPADHDPAPLVAAIAAGGGRGKIRTGGVTADAFPTARAVVRFIEACVESGVPFKATAGLHHPLRGDYALTYANGSPCGTMFGFLNVFVAAALIAQGIDSDSAERLLKETSPAALHLTPESIEWEGHRLDVSAIEDARERAIVSFGSCSFTEPIDDLIALGWLETTAV